MNVLIESPPRYDFLVATAAQGLSALGHKVYGFDGNENNYLTPHEGQEIDVIIQCLENGRLKRRPDIPFIVLWGADSGQGTKAVPPPPVHTIQADAWFIRDYRGDLGPNVFPINFGIEKRYYSGNEHIAPKPLADRSIDVFFCGQFDNAPGRRELISVMRAELGGRFNLMIEDRPFKDTDDYWSKWMGAHVIHSPRYFEALADSKIVLSPMGAGPDCGRHWEALASGGIAFLPRVPNLTVPMWPLSWIHCVMSGNPHDAAMFAGQILENPGRFQAIASSGYQLGMSFHQSIHRAHYMMGCLKKIGLIP